MRSCRYVVPLLVWPVCALAVWAIGLTCQDAAAQIGPGRSPNYADGSRRYPLNPVEPERSPVPNRFEAPRADGGELVVDVRIVGNEAVTPDQILGHIKTREDQAFDEVTLEGDARELMKLGLFRKVDTFTERTPAGVVVIFQVYELPTVTYVKFIGNRSITDKKLLKESGLAVGQALNSYRVKEARQKVEDYYHSKGYPKTQVTVLEGGEAGDRGVVLLVNEDRKRRVWHVEFIGNTIASDGRLKTQIRSKPPFLKLPFLGGEVDPAKIEEDVQRVTAYYRSLGYFNAKVGRELIYNEAGDWLTLRFYINEGPRYAIRNIAVIGNRKFASEDLLGQLTLKPGDYYHSAKMNSDVSTLMDLYGSQGHIFADVRPEPRFLEEPGQLDLVFDITEGAQYRVGRINVHIAGQYPHTKEMVVRNRISLVPGDIIDIREIRDSERRLKASQLFVNEPHRGIAPRIVVLPPDTLGSESIADQPRGGSQRSNYRGQSPDRPAWPGEVRYVDMNVFLQSH